MVAAAPLPGIVVLMSTTLKATERQGDEIVFSDLMILDIDNVVTPSDIAAELAKQGIIEPIDIAGLSVAELMKCLAEPKQERSSVEAVLYAAKKPCWMLTCPNPSARPA